ncbi:MAG: hypothetical protein ACJ79L_10975, partial [Anaeromyxobacteraceae bacterium]
MTRSARAALALLVAAASCTASQPARRAGAGDLGALAAARLDGTPVALRGPGSPRLVELWATWCEPCAHAAAAARPVL